MVTKYKPYPAYKDSGISWLGEVPAGWEVSPLKRGFDVTLGKMLQPEARSINDSLEPYLRAANIQWDGVNTTDVKEMWFSETEKKQLKLQQSDLLVSEGGDVGRSAIWNNELPNCYFQNSINRVRSREGNQNRFLYYWIYTIKDGGYIDILCNRSTIAHLTEEKLQALPVLFPSSPEQQTIAAFLDHETAKIDILIAKQEHLIDLLQEKRTALISHVVTKGLDPDAPMKDSGVEWLGEAPEHWEVVRNKVIFGEADDRSQDSSGELLTVSHLTGVTPRSEKNVNMFMAETLEGYKKCRIGDLVINTMWAWMGALGISACDGLVSPSYNVYRIRDFSRAFPKYYDYLYRIPEHVVIIKAYSTGVWESRLRLYPDIFLSMEICLPPLEEQKIITTFLDHETTKIDTLIQKARQAIDLLKERRTALISAAVTGKIDVRDHV